MKAEEDEEISESRPKRFGRYKIIEQLAVGGMAQIFKAQTAHGKIFTLKKILKDFSTNNDFIRMFLDEARISLSLKHPHIIRVLDFGQMDGTYYLAMEYVFGRDIASVLRVCAERRIYIPIDVACFIILQCARGLDYAHSQVDSFGKSLEIVHRDISPPNILLSYNGEAKVLDFGIAKAAKASGRSNTRSGVLKGKFSYMSPEQAMGEPLNNQSDVFSLGIVLYELLTTRSLFYSEDEIETLERVRKAKIKMPSKFRKDIPAGLEKIAMKALELKLKNRYRSCGEMAEALYRFLKTQYPRSDPRVGAKFLRACFPDDFQKRQKSALHEGWRDILQVGAADEDLLLDQTYNGPIMNPMRTGEKEISWYQKMIYDPRTRANLQKRSIQVSVLIVALALIASFLDSRSRNLWVKESKVVLNAITGDSQKLPTRATTSSSAQGKDQSPLVGSFAYYVSKAEEAEKSENFKQALEFYDRAIEINSFEPSILIRRAFMQLAEGKYKEACPWFQSQANIPSADLLLSQAACSEIKGETQRALAAYSEFIQKFPTEPRAFSVRDVLASLRKKLK